MNVEGLRKDFFIYPRFIHRPQVPLVALVRLANFTDIYAMSVPINKL